MEGTRETSRAESYGVAERLRHSVMIEDNFFGNHVTVVHPRIISVAPGHTKDAGMPRTFPGILLRVVGVSVSNSISAATIRKTPTYLHVTGSLASAQPRRGCIFGSGYL